MAVLEELNPLTPTGDPTQLAQLALEAVGASTRVSTLDEAEVSALTDQAFRIRPELAGLSEQARGLAAQAAVAARGRAAPGRLRHGLCLPRQRQLDPARVRRRRRSTWTGQSPTAVPAGGGRGAPTAGGRRAEAPGRHGGRHGASRSAPAGSTSGSRASTSQSPAWRSSRQRKTSTSSPSAIASR